MIRALLLIVDPSRTWEAIKNDQHSVARISTSFLIPLLILTCAGEALGMMRFGIDRGGLSEKLVTPSQDLLVRYEVTQALLSLIIIYAGAIALKGIGASFHRRHSYTECFTTLAYSMSPLFLLRLLDGVPAINTWVCYGVGVFLVMSFLYRGIPFIMRPDPSNALGLFMFCAFLLLGTTGLAHFVVTQVLDGKFFG